MPALARAFFCVIMYRTNIKKGLKTLTDKIEISREDLSECVQAGVRSAFIRIGLDYDNPFELQKDMAHLRSHREKASDMKTKILMGSIAILTTGFWVGLWNLLVSFVQHKA